MRLCNTKIDVVEEKLQRLSPSLLRALLRDKTTRANIVWATDDYAKELGAAFAHDREITEKLVTGEYWNVVQPRTAKLKATQDERTRARAEVFTPAWICNRQNNLADAQWFGRENVFNEETENDWIAFHEKISFPEGKTWRDYIDAVRLEITCGEAPYLVSRYDSTTGDFIKIERRIGLLDRKFRILQENATSDEEWLTWALRALQSVYGYEFQGDSLLIARENILYTFIENYKVHFRQMPEVALLRKAINIIVWNLWQMDGRTFATPYLVNKSKIKPELPLLKKVEKPPLSEPSALLKPLESIEPSKSSAPPSETSPNTPPYCLIMNWRKRKKVIFKSLLKGEAK